MHDSCVMSWDFLLSETVKKMGGKKKDQYTVKNGNVSTFNYVCINIMNGIKFLGRVN